MTTAIVADAAMFTTFRNTKEHAGYCNLKIRFVYRSLSRWLRYFRDKKAKGRAPNID
jgi:hypothetical protein